MMGYSMYCLMTRVADSYPLTRDLLALEAVQLLTLTGADATRA